MGKDSIPAIDFVVPFVDGSDPVWQAEKQRYLKDYSSDMSDHSDYRYRDWGTLKYFFRGVESCAPWIRKLFFIVSERPQIPEWLDESNPKLEIVLHRDFIPEEYLPTFSSHCIEMNLHRIRGLSEQFVYFNDDMFLIRHFSPDFFFKKGLPCDTAILRPWPYIDVEPDRKPLLAALHCVAAINRNFSKPACMRRYFYKWFSPVMGIRIISTLWLVPAREFTGFTNLHLMNPFLKSTFSEVWEKEGVTLKKACLHRFREPNDVNQYIFQYWQFASGKFIPRPHEVGRSRSIKRENIKDIQRIMANKKYRAIALNDADMPENEFELLRNEINSIFSERFPDKSSFEK